MKNVISIFLFLILFIAEVTAQTLPNLIPMRVGESFGYCNRQGEMIIPAEYERAQPFCDDVAKVRKNKLWGLIDVNGNALTEFKYKSIGELERERIRVEIDGDKRYGYVDREGNEVIPPQFSSASDFYEGRASVKSGRLYGYIDETGKMVVSAKYEEANNFINGSAVVGKTGKYQLIGPNGKTLLPATFKRLGNFTNNYLIFKTYQGYGFMYKDFQKASEEFYEKAFDYDDNGNAWVRKEGKWGLIDGDFKVVIPFKYESAKPFTNEIAPVKLNGKWGFIDKNDNTVIDLKYEDINNFMENSPLTAAKLGGKWGYIDREGKVKIDFKFDSYSIFVDGLAQVKENYLYGYMNTDGEIVIPCIYEDAAYYFTNGLSKVIKDGERFYIDYTGKEYIQ